MSSYCLQPKCKACRTAKLEIKHSPKQGLLMKKPVVEGQWSLISSGSLLALARCVFYCFLIIARLLSGSLYCSRQAAWLLNAYEADTSSRSAATAAVVVIVVVVAVWGWGEGRWSLLLCVGDSHHVSCMAEREWFLGKSCWNISALNSASFSLTCWAEANLSGSQQRLLLNTVRSGVCQPVYVSCSLQWFMNSATKPESFFISLPEFRIKETL